MISKKILALVVIVLSVVLTILGVSALAQVQNPQSGSVGIEGTIPADPPATGATISFPVNGEIFTEVPITVSGICPADLLVKMFKNQVFAGSVVCLANGTFDIEIDLFSDRNEIVAKVFDALDQPGPDSNTVTVTYNDSSGGSRAEKLILTSNFATRGADPGATLVWPLGLSGGVGPYAVSIDWGDGTNDIISLDSTGNFNLDHKYEQPGTYKTTVKAAGSEGDTAFLQLVSVSNGLLQGNLNDISTAQQVITRRIFVLWPLYIMIGFVITSFWLGRKDELRRIRKRIEKNEQVF